MQYSDMLFQSSEHVDFKIDSLFENSALAKSLLSIEMPEALKLKPSELYARIRHVAKARYGHDLPES